MSTVDEFQVADIKRGINWPVEMVAIRGRAETDDIFGSRSIHATAVFDDAVKDRKKLLHYAGRLEKALKEGFDRLEVNHAARGVCPAPQSNPEVKS